MIVLLSSASKPGLAGSWLDAGAQLWARRVLLPLESLCPPGGRNRSGSVVQRELVATACAVWRGGGGCLSVVRREAVERQGQVGCPGSGLGGRGGSGDRNAQGGFEKL